MKLNTNIQWGEFEKRGFFKINSRIVEVCDLSLETQQEYWRLINKNKNNLDALYYKFKSDENFNKFLVLYGCLVELKMVLMSGHVSKRNIR